MSEWSVLEGGRRRRRRVSWASVAVWGGTIVLCVTVWALVAWIVSSILPSVMP